MTVIRRATPADENAVWEIIGPTIRAGETYPLDRDLGKDAALRYWMDPEKETFVVDDAGELAGTYYIRPNQLGGGRHVCNCGYMTSSGYAGRGIARQMFAHSFDRARALGYRAMQFNFVVSVNERAVRLWQSLGFEIVGRLPGAFLHPTAGFVDALVMYMTL
jgi:ribosomal protein S18 acetylase RimI-like enzyme